MIQSRSMSTIRTLAILARVMLAGVFLFAFATKILTGHGSPTGTLFGPFAFAFLIEKQNVLAPQLAVLAAFAVLLWEFALAVWLLLHRGTILAASACLGTLVRFTCYLLFGVSRTRSH